MIRLVQRFTVACVALIFFGITLATPAAAAERCSARYATGPNRLDTMRVCLNWTSRTLQGTTYYYSSREFAPHTVNFVIHIERGDGRFLGWKSSTLTIGTNSLVTPQTAVVGNVSGNQAYVVRVTAWNEKGRPYFDDTRSSPLVVA